MAHEYLITRGKNTQCQNYLIGCPSFAVKKQNLKLPEALEKKKESLIRYRL